MGARFLFAWIAALFLASAFAASAQAEKSLEKLREEYSRETDPVKRAKFFHKLSSALIAEMRRQEEAGNYDRVPPLFLEYHQDVAAAFSALMATGRDAEKHPKGFLELEMQLREALRPLNDLLFGLPLEDRQALRATLHDLQSMDDQLVRALFPGNPGSPKTPPSGSRPHP